MQHARQGLRSRTTTALWSPSHRLSTWKHSPPPAVKMREGRVRPLASRAPLTDCSAARVSRAATPPRAASDLPTSTWLTRAIHITAAMTMTYKPITRTNITTNAAHAAHNLHAAPLDIAPRHVTSNSLPLIDDHRTHRPEARTYLHAPKKAERPGHTRAAVIRRKTHAAAATATRLVAHAGPARLSPPAAGMST